MQVYIPGSSPEELFLDLMAFPVSFGLTTTSDVRGVTNEY